MASVTPKEIWVEIWSQVDFGTLQKSCTLVCKDWFGGIRGSTSLSSHMAFNNRQKSIEDINQLLSYWEKLRIVRMSDEISKAELTQLDTHPSLEKIIFPREFWPDVLGKVTRVCFNIKNKSSETSIENIVELHLVNFFNKPHQKNYDYEDHDEDEHHEPVLKCLKTEDISMEHMAHKMLNLETLHVFSDYYYDDIEQEKLNYFGCFFRGLQRCKNLSELILPMDFGDYANYTPNIKKLKIKGGYDFPLEDFDWVANLKKLEILKLEMFRVYDKEIDIEDLTRKMFGNLTNLKSLELDDCSLMYETEFLSNIHEIIPSLQTLLMRKENDSSYPMYIGYLVEVLDSIANIKNLCIEPSYPPVFYLVNNQDFRKTLPNNLDEDETKSIFQTAMDVINRKFPINSTSIEIVDSAYGWTIKKEKDKPPTMSQLLHKCTVKDDQGKTCTEFFAEKEEWEKHVKEALKRGLEYGHSFPFCW